MQALALALLLLVTQQWGLAHGLQHRGAGAAGFAGPASAAPVSADSRHTSADTSPDPAADTLCATCLALAGMGGLVPPQAPVWALTQTLAPALAARPVPTWAATAALPFRARAPPVLS